MQAPSSADESCICTSLSYIPCQQYDSMAPQQRTSRSRLTYIEVGAETDAAAAAGDSVSIDAME